MQGFTVEWESHGFMGFMYQILKVMQVNTYCIQAFFKVFKGGFCYFVQNLILFIVMHVYCKIGKNTLVFHGENANLRKNGKFHEFVGQTNSQQENFVNFWKDGLQFCKNCIKA